MVTSPIITAAGSIHALAAICGHFPRKARMSGTLANIPRGSQLETQQPRYLAFYLNGDCVSSKEIESVTGCGGSLCAAGPVLACNQSICTDGPVAVAPTSASRAVTARANTKRLFAPAAARHIPLRSWRHRRDQKCPRLCRNADKRTCSYFRPRPTLLRLPGETFQWPC